MQITELNTEDPNYEAFIAGEFANGDEPLNDWLENEWIVACNDDIYNLISIFSDDSARKITVSLAMVMMFIGATI